MTGSFNSNCLPWEQMKEQTDLEVAPVQNKGVKRGSAFRNANALSGSFRKYYAVFYYCCQPYPVRASNIVSCMYVQYLHYKHIRAITILD